MQQQFSVLVPIAVLLGIACLVAVYFSGLYAMIRATRLPQSSHLHPSRAQMAAILVLLSFLLPIVSGFIICVGKIKYENDIKQQRYESREQDRQRQNDIITALRAVQNEIDDKANDITAQDKERMAYAEASRNLSISVNSRMLEMHNSTGMIISSPRFGVVGLAAPTLFLLLFYGFPGTILGIGYVAQVRKDKERPGLIAGLLAMLTWPVIIIIGGTTGAILAFGLTGFLIVLTIGLIGVGTAYVVRYWLSY